MLGFVATIATALAVGACGATGPTGESATAAASPAVEPLDLRYACGTFPFGPEILTAGPGNAELANTPAAAALRAHLAGEGPDFDFLPDAGWHLTGMNARLAEFVVGGDGGMMSVSMENNPEGWQITGWGECQARLELAGGLASADWSFDPGQPKPDATTQAFDAMVSERNCASGQPAAGRIVGPEFVKSADAVLVIFAVRPLAGANDCQGAPATRVAVDLGEPLGNRRLLDGGRLPLGDPAAPQ